jgi:hypothetical protein
MGSGSMGITVAAFILPDELAPRASLHDSASAGTFPDPSRILPLIVGKMTNA